MRAVAGACRGDAERIIAVLFDLFDLAFEIRIDLVVIQQLVEVIQYALLRAGFKRDRAASFAIHPLVFFIYALFVLIKLPDGLGVVVALFEQQYAR